MIHATAMIDALARVDESVSIGARSRVWQFCTVIRGAAIGEDCNMAAGACLDGSRVGDRTKIGHNFAAGPGFLIGSDCFIGPNVTLCNDAFPRAHVEGWNASEFDGSKWAVIIEDGASIGANCVILPGVRIGAGAMIAAGSQVPHDVPANCIWTGKGEIRSIHKQPRRMRFARAAGLAR